MHVCLCVFVYMVVHVVFIAYVCCVVDMSEYVFFEMCLGHFVLVVVAIVVARKCGGRGCVV